MSNSLNIRTHLHSGKILASALLLSKKLAKPGISPEYIDLEIHRFILSQKASPSFLGLDGFPCATCISVNSQLVHAVPSKRPLVNGDIVTVDIGVSYKRHCTDAARTFVIGKATKKQKFIIETTALALDAGIAEAISGNRVGDISYAIQRRVELNGFRSPLEFGGHGIGFKPHEEPFIPNAGIKGIGPKLVTGNCLAIEPIVLEGSIEIFIDADDGFTYFTNDGKLSAHIEDTIVVSDHVPIILTRETLCGGII